MNLPKYELIDTKDAYHDEHWSIKITEGLYEGLVYQYDTVNITEDDDGEGAVLHFNTITVANPNNVDLTKENDNGILGGILAELINDSLELISEGIERENENGTSDSEESTD